MLLIIEVIYSVQKSLLVKKIDNVKWFELPSLTVKLKRFAECHGTYHNFEA
jgi:hypothetical protein